MIGRMFNMSTNETEAAAPADPPAHDGECPMSAPFRAAIDFFRLDVPRNRGEAPADPAPEALPDAAS